jgi:aspartyl protease family protein
MALAARLPSPGKSRIARSGISGLFALPRWNAVMRTIMTFAALALAAAIFVPRYADKAHMGQNAPTLMAAQSADQTMPASPVDSRSVTLSRNAQGHFQTDARIEGRRLTLMVDTGASVIALTADTAASLGIHPTPNDYTAAVKTANGVVRAAPVELSMVEIEDISLHNVSAMVLPEGALSDNLLGMSFLSRLHRWEFADGRLVLEQ